jgi:diadenosine tetraphosphate (Ap4A) HIT family hydrolase
MSGEAHESECGTCRANRGEIPTPGGVIYQDELWRLEHTFEPIPLVGWLVLKSLRHIEVFADFTDDEAATLGPLIRRTTAAMLEALQPTKVYVCQFSEAEGFAHLHFHLIPRFADTPAELRGPHVFDLLRQATEQRRNLADLAEAAKAADAIRDVLQWTET